MFLEDGVLTLPTCSCSVGFKHGQKNRFFRPIFRRKIGFRWCWKRFSGGKIGSKKIGEKSSIFPINTDFFSEKTRFFLGKKISDFFPVFSLAPKI